MKKVYVVLILVLLYCKTVLAALYLPMYQGNTPLELAGPPDKFAEYFLSGSREGLNESVGLMKDLIEVMDNKDEYIVYSVGDEKVYFMTNIQDKKSGPMLKLEFGDMCFYRIWLDGEEINPERISDVIDTIYLVDHGEYTILISPYDGERFFEKYSRYDCSVDGILGNYYSGDGTLDHKVTYHYDNDRHKFVYKYMGNEILWTNIPSGIVCNEDIRVEIGSLFNVVAVLIDGEKANSRVTHNRIMDFTDFGHYVIIGETSANEEENIAILDFTIADVVYTNCSFVNIPSGIDILRLKINGKISSPSYINKNTIELIEDGQYDIEYGVSGEGVYYKNVVIKDTDKNLIEFNQDISEKRVTGDLEIKKLKENAQLTLYHNGFKIGERSVLNKSGTYNVRIEDKAGNKQYFYFIRDNNVINIIAMFFIVIISGIALILYINRSFEK